MADIQTTAQLASSLTTEETPIKLRCATCNRLAANAFRLPCCDQSICETCQSQLPTTCPVCEHSPLSADDCKPNKALRLTVKAFLKSEEKKRDKQRKQSVAQADASAPDAPSHPVPSTDPEPDNAAVKAEVEVGSANRAEAGQGKSSPDAAPAEGGDGQATEQAREHDSADGAVQLPQPKMQTNVHPADDPKQDDEAPTEPAGSVDGPQQQNPMWNNASPQQMFGNGLGLGNQPSGFPGMNWPNPGFGMMPNAMGQNGWNGFPNMMGMMPGMGMNPAGMPQGMFGSFGGQGMGMNNMNMGMGFDGGYTNGWVGQQMTGGDFGNAGYYPGGGYNQQSRQGQFSNQLNQMNPHRQQFQNNYQNAYAQGPDFRRGSQQGQAEEAGQGNDPDHRPTQNQTEPGDTSVDDTTFHQQLPSGSPSQAPGRPTGDGPQDGEARAESTSAPDGSNQTQDQTETGAEDSGQGEVLAANKQADDPEANERGISQPDASRDQNAIQTFQPTDSNQGGVYGQEPMMNASPYGPGMGGPMNPAYDQMDPYAQQHFQPGMHGYMPRGRGYGRGGYGRGAFDSRRGGFHGPAYNSEFKVVTPQEPMGQGVAGAPTGPKAMREGNVRGRGGFGAMQRGGSTAGSALGPGTDSSKRRSDSVPKRNEPSPSRSKSPAASRDRSRSKSSSRRRRHRDRHSRSPSKDSRYGRSQHRTSRKYDDDRHSGLEDDASKKELSSRDRSADSSRQSSRRDKEKHRSSRSYRDRSRDRGRDRDNRRRRHRHRSTSLAGNPTDEHEAEDAEVAESEASHKRSRSDRYHDRDKDRYRDRHRDRDRGRDREKDRDRKDRDKAREKDRKRSRADHSPSLHDTYSDDDRYSRRERRKRRDREYREKEKSARSRGHSPNVHDDDLPPPSAASSKAPSTLHSPMSESKGFGRTRVPKAAPTGPSKMVEPASAPTESLDPYQQEREARHRERIAKEEQRRKSLQQPQPRLHVRGASYSGGAGSPVDPPSAGSGRKRGWPGDEDRAPPTEPSALRGRRRDGKGRRVSYKYEDEENDEVRAARIERERERVRWG